jgi:hypothetical protein
MFSFHAPFLAPLSFVPSLKRNVDAVTLQLEEFFTVNEKLDMTKFNSLGVIKNEPDFNNQSLDQFIQFIDSLKLLF